VIYEDVFRALQKNKVRYVVVGGIAVNFHGILRATADLDLMIHLKDDKNVENFVRALKKLKFRPRVPVAIEQFTKAENRRQWQKDKGALVFTLDRPGSFEQVDVFLREPIGFDFVYERRKVFRVNGVAISVASLRDLKALKLKAGREKDISDIKHITRLQRMKK
jgi:predicted nucleotidyltransferase